ncbi:DUF3376 domain-containing protein [Actinomycetospora flava]|uniref:DUF3376 domain-containing protein n=1 Tax=Actinomycetospora flava TaxID=3129232 RepID=A0ABU8M5V3_9PSEU
MTPPTVRLALVLNGGISLAVWMAGVVKELDLAARATSGRTGGLSAAEIEYCKEWRRICAGRRLEIDVIAGTSAGGLNGTLLATSQALSSSLPDLKTMWRTSAKIEAGHLLPPDESTSSILDGQYFADTAAATLDLISGAATTASNDAAPPAQVPSSPTTLFVTSTALGEQYRDYEDSYGRHFDAADHRRVYRFRSHAPDGGNEFDTSFASLARAARASAGYPVAFAPVEETDELRSLNRRVDGRPAWLIDGGVLDNSPFEPVLDEVLRRHVDTAVERIIAYIVPSNGSLHEGGAAAPPSPGPAPAWTEVLKAALGFRSESDFRGDIETLAGVLAESDAQRGASARVVRSVLRGGAGGLGSALAVAEEALYPLYVAEEPARDRAALVGRVARRTGRTRIEPSPEPPQVGPDAGDVPLPEALGVLGHAASERMVRLLLADIRERLEQSPPSEGLTTAASTVSEALSTLVVCREAMEDELLSEEAATDPEGAAQAALDARVTERNTLLEGALDAYSNTVEADRAAVGRVVRATEIVMQAVSPRTRPAPPPFRLLRIGPDTPSPLAPGSALWGQKKLFGTALGHFGAFGEESWRDWDYTWGRLDAAANLADVLGADPDDIEVLQDRIRTAEGVEDIDTRLEEVVALEDAELRQLFAARGRLDGLLGSASRFLRAEHPGQPALLATIAPWVGSMIRPRPLPRLSWVLPGTLVRRWIRSQFQ